MRILFKNGIVYQDGLLACKDFVFDSEISDDNRDCLMSYFDEVYDVPNCYIIPGLADVHAHLREPGFSYKETIATGTAAAARGGFTAICAMPNVVPPPDCEEHFEIQMELVRKNAIVPVFPYASITKGAVGRGELTNIKALAPFAVGFSDDGKGVQDAWLMEEAMNQVALAGSIISAHCEDESQLNGGYIHDGEYAMRNGHKGISSDSEWRQLERDLEIVSKTGCNYHVCHVSTAESVELIRTAKSRGLPVSGETAPHYLLLTDCDLKEDGRFKMNPPLRTRRDRDALVRGIIDGSIDIIATDHAPHSMQEKSLGLERSAMGVSGLETALSVVFTALVRNGPLNMTSLLRLMCTKPRKRFKLGGGEIGNGVSADFVLFDPEADYVVEPKSFLSMGKATPFKGMRMWGKVLLTVCGGKIVWRSDEMDDHNIIM